MVSFSVYIIYSAELDRYYVGHCQDIEERIRRHNSSSGSIYTKRVNDWMFKWSAQYETRLEASQMERSIKKKKSRKYIEYLISKGNRN